MKENRTLEEDLKDLMIKASVDAANKRKKISSELTLFEKYLKKLSNCLICLSITSRFKICKML